MLQRLPKNGLPACLLWVGAVILLRVIPHLPNLSFVGVAAMLLVSKQSFWKSAACLLLSLALSDVALALFSSEPLFGNWDLFTYSGILLWLVFGRYADWSGCNFSPVLLAFVASMSYWLWTNFGTWLAAGIYVHSLTGLLACYIAALPFLQSALLGSTCGSLALVLAAKKYRKLSAGQLIG